MAKITKIYIHNSFFNNYALFVFGTLLLQKKSTGWHGDTVKKGLGPRPLGPIGPMVQGPWGPYAAMQLLAAMQLRGSGTGPGQATAWLQAAAWLRMGPMGPRGLGPWALRAPGAHTAIIFRLDCYFTNFKPQI